MHLQDKLEGLEDQLHRLVFVVESALVGQAAPPTPNVGSQGISLQRYCGGSSKQIHRKQGIVEISPVVIPPSPFQKGGVAHVSIGHVVFCFFCTRKPVQLHNKVHLICRIIRTWHSALQQ